LNEPALSVIVAATDSAVAVARTVASLLGPHDGARLEIVVVAAADRIRPPGDPTGVRWIAAEGGAGVPRLRRLGLDHATAPIVVFTEDSCRFDLGWAESWLEAFEDPALAAATGVVEPSMGNAACDWAVFFCEYAPFLSGRRPTRLAGNHFGMRRSICDRIDGAEIHEMALPGAASRTIAFVPARADHVRRYALCEAIGDRLRFGFAFGRLRARGQSLPLRAAGWLAGPAILAVQAARLTWIVLRLGRFVDRYFEILPVTLALLAAWSVGEWLGWVSAPIHPASDRRRHETGDRPAARRPVRDRSRRRRCTTSPGPA
jgi:hypothetical protein